MHASQRWSALIAGVLLAAAAAAALAGGQERESFRGQKIPPVVGAKVVTEHVPVLPLPFLWKNLPKSVPPKDVAARMGFRVVRQKEPEPPVKPTPKSAPKPAPVPALPTDAWFRMGRARLSVGDYAGAAVQFSRSARESEKDGDALLALAVALAGLAEDERAARSFRRAIRREPELLSRSIDPAVGFRDAAEFDRVLKALEKRAAAVPGNADAKFTLAVIRFFRMDARCKETFAWQVRVTPKDEAAKLCHEAAERRLPKKKTKSSDPSVVRREGVEK